MLNLIAFVLSIICAMLHLYLGNIGIMFIELAIASMNLPFAIMWLDNKFKRK